MVKFRSKDVKGVANSTNGTPMSEANTIATQVSMAKVEENTQTSADTSPRTGRILAETHVIILYT